MPHDIEVNTNIPNTKLFFSITIELFSAIQLLVNPTHHEFARDFSEKMLKSLSKKSRNTLKILEKFQYDGLELFDFVLDLDIHDDVFLFIEKFLEYSDSEFVSVFTDHTINESIFNKIKNQDLSKKEIEKIIPLMFKDSIEELSEVLFSTTKFKEHIANFLLEVYQSPYFSEQIHIHETHYKDSLENLNKALKKVKPLELGQQLMGKTFRRLFDYKAFHFSPSYFISPHRIRLHNERVNYVVYDLRRDHLYLNEIGEEISNVLKIISDRTRLEILRKLSRNKTYGKVLANSLDLTTATISHHLDQLKSIGLVKEEKVKNIKYFSFDEERYQQILELTNNYIQNKL